ncbi:hypothetical protein [Pandoraea bronchicola]|uniref:Uncharacterized protein n=1 Tax=Pandoraea bronchicola TaxID=2508287 RepID=A0A5E5BSI1_9BURK|nr:hypothetical protein [Pandoraea bronchicola]VVE88035.1 hypothetical protein PBR20603_01979 [Pandoraea bronchicola]
MKKLLVVALGVAFIANSASDVEANPLMGGFATFTLNQVVALVSQKAAERDGIPESDPRIEATHRAMSLVATEHTESTLGERMLMAAGAPTWFGLATTLIGAQLGELVAGKIGKTEVSISAMGDGTLELTRKVDIPIPPHLKPYEPPAYKATHINVKNDPWDAMAAAGANVYRESSCKAGAPCAKYPPEPELSGNLGGWYRISGDGLRALVLNRADVEKFFLVYFETKLKNDGETFRNLRVRIVDEYDADGQLHNTHSFRSHETEQCKTVFGSELDLTAPNCPEAAKSAPDPFKWPTCTRTVTTETCEWVRSPEKNTFFDDLNVSQWRPEPLDPTEYGPQERRETFKSLDESFDSLSKDVLDLPLNPKFVADVANALAAIASQRSDYKGVPYRMTAPITPQEVKAWMDEKSRDAVPRLVDVFSRPTPDYERVVPIQVQIRPDRVWPDGRRDPDPRVRPDDRGKDRERPGDPLSRDVNVVNTPGVNVINPVLVDAGPAPDVGAPGLESPPTPNAILSPILGLLPDFKSWRTPSHTATCPRPVFDVFQTRIRMDAMCDIAERHRKTIRTVMLAVFVLIALTILLAA